MDTFWGLSSGENLVLLYTNNKGADQTAQIAQSGQSPCYSLSSKMITKLDPARFYYSKTEYAGFHLTYDKFSVAIRLFI